MSFITPLSKMLASLYCIDSSGLWKDQMKHFCNCCWENEVFFNRRVHSHRKCDSQWQKQLFSHLDWTDDLKASKGEGQKEGGMTSCASDKWEHSMGSLYSLKITCKPSLPFFLSPWHKEICHVWLREKRGNKRMSDQYRVGMASWVIWSKPSKMEGWLLLGCAVRQREHSG